MGHAAKEAEWAAVCRAYFDSADGDGRLAIEYFQVRINKYIYIMYVYIIYV
jgi:hypothetical protein